MDEDMLTEALKLYNWNDSLTMLNSRNEEIRFSKSYHDPQHSRIAYEMSKSFIAQQLDWSVSMEKLYRRFFDHFIHQRAARDEEPDING